MAKDLGVVHKPYQRGKPGRPHKVTSPRLSPEMLKDLVDGLKDEGLRRALRERAQQREEQKFQPTVYPGMVFPTGFILPPFQPVKLTRPKRERKLATESKLTDEMATKILLALRCGAYQPVACAVAGVRYGTFVNWLRWKGQPYEEFQMLVKQQENMAELHLLNIIIAGAYADPKLALEILARKHPDRWSRVHVISGTGPGGSIPVDMNFPQMVDETYAKIFPGKHQTSIPKRRQLSLPDQDS